MTINNLKFYQPTLNLRMFEELVRYILSKKGPITEQYLYLIMWKSDMLNYAYTGKSMTGCQWRKTEDGVEPRFFNG